jgi:hypothetical protein
MSDATKVRENSIIIGQFRALVFGLLLLAAATDAQGGTGCRWVVPYLPEGITTQTASPAQLGSAVKLAIRNHPKQAKAIAECLFSEFSPGDNAKALAVIDAIIATVPKDEVAGLIKVAIGSLSVTVDPQTGQSPQAALTSILTQQAIADDPGLTSAILAAIGAAPAGPTSQLLGPGSVTNPANFSNTSGSVNSPQ